MLEFIANLNRVISEEYLAVASYTELAAKCPIEEARKILLDIADEEKVHYGELKALLSLFVDDSWADKEGAEEVKELLKDSDLSKKYLEKTQKDTVQNENLSNIAKLELAILENNVSEVIRDIIN